MRSKDTQDKDCDQVSRNAADHALSFRRSLALWLRSSPFLKLLIWANSPDPVKIANWPDAVKKVLFWFCYPLGGLFGFLALLSFWAYIYAAIIEPWGEPDQSMLYWGLVFVMIGIVMTGVSFTFFNWGAVLKKSLKKKENV